MTRTQPTWQRSHAFPGLGVIALAYVVLDYIQKNSEWLSPSVSELIQPGLWGCLAIYALCEAPLYKYWRTEFRTIPQFLASLIFMIFMLSVEVIMVHFVTVVLGMNWHKEADPLPDTGQWLLLALNERLPSPLLHFLRLHLIELHHFLMLFIMLAFSVLFGCIRPPGLGLGSRYCFTMGLARFFRFLSFTSTILPSARPWCAENRFKGLPSYPHPWAQRYYTPYSTNHQMIRRLLQLDMCFAPPINYPSEYIPNWGNFDFLIPFLRPINPKIEASLNSKNDKFLGLVRPGGGCNDLVFSGHVIVATLTACAWQEAFPGFSSSLIWLLVMHSGQREIRERHHYSVDVLLAILISMLLWRTTKFLWSAENQTKVKLSSELVKRFDFMVKSAKDGDLDSVREMLDAVSKASEGSGVGLDGDKKGSWLLGSLIVLVCVGLSVTVFVLMIGG